MGLHHLTARSQRMFTYTAPTAQRKAVIVLAKGRRPTNKAREVVVGIDLGTTNSAVAVIEAGAPVCIPNQQGNTTTPSVVAFAPDSTVLLGSAAKRQAALNPENTFFSVKRLIGRSFDDPAVKEELPRLPYKVTADEDGSVKLACRNNSKGYVYPEDVSAYVLSALLADAERHTGGKVTKAVISVPAYFNEQQREATIAAGKIAGLDTIRILREPVAAALAYGLNLSQDQTVLVVDLGGGTYDISLLEVGNGTVEVLSTGGDAHLGGDDWDDVIVRWLETTYLRPARVDCTNPAIVCNLKALAEFAKMQLSEHEEVVLRMPLGGPGGGPLAVTLTRAMFDKLTEPLFRRCRLPLDQACWQAGVDLNEVMAALEQKRADLAQRNVPQWKRDTLRAEIRPKKRDAISKVLLVGGATRMPALRQFVRNMTGIEADASDINPDEAVALGAAVQAGILQGEVSDMMVMDVWQASLMRALAELQLKQDQQARRKVEEKYQLEDEDGVAEGEEQATEADTTDVDEADLLPEQQPRGSDKAQVLTSTDNVPRKHRVSRRASRQRQVLNDDIG